MLMYRTNARPEKPKRKVDWKAIRARLHCITTYPALFSTTFLVWAAERYTLGACIVCFCVGIIWMGAPNWTEATRNPIFIDPDKDL